MPFPALNCSTSMQLRRSAHTPAHSAKEDLALRPCTPKTSSKMAKHDMRSDVQCRARRMRRSVIWCEGHPHTLCSSLCASQAATDRGSCESAVHTVGSKPYRPHAHGSCQRCKHALWQNMHDKNRLLPCFHALLPQHPFINAVMTSRGAPSKACSLNTSNPEACKRAPTEPCPLGQQAL